jgi:putative membrane protein insertion efficiency factor
VSQRTRRRLRFGLGLAALLLLAWDWSRPAAAQWSGRGLVAAIHLYQATLSPRLPVQCRFQPTCSHYGEAAIRKYGTLKGVLLTIGRIGRCGPWTPAGTYDPP